MPRLNKTARIEARVPADLLAVVKHAAELQGRTITDFVVSAAREAAYKAIEETEIIRVSMEDYERITEAIRNPPEPTPALVRAMQRRQELFGTE
ncbi:MAG: DUF1778 domain-containing protein [Bryobacteraceae bacterium]|nr:DUF1778 domain-containing protein [Bryobacteraceae bacterium]